MRATVSLDQTAAAMEAGVAKRLVMTLALAIVSAAVIAEPQAWATSVMGTGTVSCTGMSGVIKDLRPPSMNVGFVVRLSGCNASAGSNVTNQNFTAKLVLYGELPEPIDAGCAALPFSGTFQIIAFLINWKTAIHTTGGFRHLVSTRVDLGQPGPAPVIAGIASGMNGNPGIRFENVPMVGSFDGTLSGEIDAGQSASAIQARCLAHKPVPVDAGFISQP